MSGVEILAVEKVATNSGFNHKACIIAFFVSFVIVLIVSFIIMFMESEPELVTIGAMFGMVFGILIGILAGVACAEPTEYRDEYKVIVSDEVSMNDFFEKYEVIDCEGSIYTVIEK